MRDATELLASIDWVDGLLQPANNDTVATTTIQIGVHDVG
jgi:hypothetical protein